MVKVLHRRDPAPPPEAMRPGLAHISGVLLNMLNDPTLSTDVKDAIREGLSHYMHPDCPCIQCFRAFGLIP